MQNIFVIFAERKEMLREGGKGQRKKKYQFKAIKKNYEED